MAASYNETGGSYTPIPELATIIPDLLIQQIMDGLKVLSEQLWRQGMKRSGFNIVDFFEKVKTAFTGNTTEETIEEVEAEVEEEIKKS